MSILDVTLPAESLWRGSETHGIEDFVINLDPVAASTLEKAATALASKEGEVTDATEHDLPLGDLKETIEKVFDVNIHHHSLYFYGTKKQS